jgi:hypothetical protein
MRERPYYDRKPKKKLEEDASTRAATVEGFSVPPGEPAFRDGYREALQMFALHAPNKRQVSKILDEHCITLENACVTTPRRENYAQYEGYRQAMKDLRAAKRMK